MVEVAQKVIYAFPHSEFSYNPDYHFVVHRLGQDPNMTEEERRKSFLFGNAQLENEYHEINHMVLRFMAEKNIRKLVMDLSYSQSLSSENEARIMKDTLPLIKQVDFKKLALILPVDLGLRQSIQALWENINQFVEFDIQFFDDQESAKEWMMER